MQRLEIPAMWIAGICVAFVYFDHGIIRWIACAGIVIALLLHIASRLESNVERGVMEASLLDIETGAGIIPSADLTAICSEPESVMARFGFGVHRDLLYCRKADLWLRQEIVFRYGEMESLACEIIAPEQARGIILNWAPRLSQTWKEYFASRDAVGSTPKEDVEEKVEGSEVTGFVAANGWVAVDDESGETRPVDGWMVNQDGSMTAAFMVDGSAYAFRPGLRFLKP
jgi:hypothetical protein